MKFARSGLTVCLRSLFRACLLALAYVGHFTSASASASASDESTAVDRRSTSSLIVRLHSTGPASFTECAEKIWDSGRSFESARSDRSEAMDRFHERFGTRSIRAVFRRPINSQRLDAQREWLAERGRRMADRFPSRRRGSSSTGHSRASSSDFSARRGRSGSSGRGQGDLAGMMAGLADVYRFELPPDTNMAAAVRALQEDPAVDFVQVNQTNALDVTLDDPFLSSAGSWGQPYADLWGLDRIRAPEAWSISQGEDVVIAVVDTGLDAAHPDIAANVWVNPVEDLNGNGVVDPEDWNGIDDDGNGFVDDLRGWNFVGFGDEFEDGTVFPGTPDTFDDNGHGSHVAGTAAAVGNNGIGIAGVAPRARVMPLKGFPAQGPARDSDLWRAVLYAIEQGARVVNGSWSCSPFCPQNPLAAEVLAIAEAAGVVFVSSAGNASRDVIANAPENTRAAITVGSIGFDDALSSFSNTGFGIDIVAPGGGPFTPFSVLAARRNILSIRSSGIRTVEEPFFVGDAYYRLSGTSMAAPAVAGAVAVLLAERPELSVAEVRRLLRLSARDKGELGHDALFGPGVLDLRELLETPGPDLALELDSPVPTEILDPEAGPIEIRGRATGNDLRLFSLAWARGLEGGTFTQIEAERPPVGGPDDDGLLTSWDASSVADGPIVIRLRGELRDGRTTDEFVVVSLERNRALRLSGTENPQREPSVSGRRVVWVSRGDGEGGVDTIQIGGFARARSGRPAVAALPALMLAASADSQRSPRVASGRVVWIERDSETGGERLMSCGVGGLRPLRAVRSERAVPVRPALLPARAAAAGRFPGHHNGQGLLDCRPVELARSELRIDPISFARGFAGTRVLWSTRTGGLFGVLQCLIRGGSRGCTAPPQRLPDDDAATGESIRLLDFDGRNALWRRSLGASGIVSELCTIDPRPGARAGACHPIPLLLSIPRLFDVASLDGRRLAVELFFGIDDWRIFHCAVDLETGECDLRPVLGSTGNSERGRNPVVSGDRITWQCTVEGEPSSVAFCEIDSIDGECRLQRVTGGFMPSGAPDLDGDRLVWEDERFGPTQILGTELPRLRTRSHLRVRAGSRAVAWIESRDPAGGGLALRLEAGEGLAPEAVGARLHSFGSGRFALLLVDPDRGSSGGIGRWRLVGEARGGWTTQSAIDVTVLPIKRPAYRYWRYWRQWLRGGSRHH